MVTDDNLLVWRPNPEEIEDRSRNQRHDFYLVKKLTIPETLAVGEKTIASALGEMQPAIRSRTEALMAEVRKGKRDVLC